MDILATLRAGAVTTSAGQTRDLAHQLALALPADTILALHGDLGVGKTTFVQGLARGFGITEAVTSPTFTIFTLHRGGSRLLVHLDAYRLEHGRQAADLMLEDFLVSPWCLAVEWPEKLVEWLPAEAWHFDFGITEDEKHTIQLR